MSGSFFLKWEQIVFFYSSMKLLSSENSLYVTVKSGPKGNMKYDKKIFNNYNFNTLVRIIKYIIDKHVPAITSLA